MYLGIILKIITSAWFVFKTLNSSFTFSHYQGHILSYLLHRLLFTIFRRLKIWTSELTYNQREYNVLHSFRVSTWLQISLDIVLVTQKDFRMLTIANVHLSLSDGKILKNLVLRGPILCRLYCLPEIPIWAGTCTFLSHGKINGGWHRGVQDQLDSSFLHLFWGTAFIFEEFSKSVSSSLQCDQTEAFRVEGEAKLTEMLEWHLCWLLCFRLRN